MIGGEEAPFPLPAEGLCLIWDYQPISFNMPCWL